MNAAPAPAPAPDLARQLANFLVFQLAWFAAILAAAHAMPAWGLAAVAGAVGWHLAVSARPSDEAKLALSACVLGGVVETVSVQCGWIAYPTGQLDARQPPYWLVALWGQLAIALNVTLRWLKRRPLLAAALGAVLGPLSFASGARLGGARFIDEPAALALLAGSWAVAMPLLMALSDRFDGVAVAPRKESSDA